MITHNFFELNLKKLYYKTKFSKSSLSVANNIHLFLNEARHYITNKGKLNTYSTLNSLYSEKYDQGY